MSEHTRIVYELGGDKHTRWAQTDSVHTHPKGRTVFEDVETGRQKVLNRSVPVVMTHDVDLPPDVRERPDGEEVLGANV